MKKMICLFLFTLSLKFLQAQLVENKKYKFKNLIDTSFNHRGMVFFANIPVLSFTTSNIALNTILSDQNAPSIGTFYFMGGLGFENRWKWFAIGLESDFGSQNRSNSNYEITSTVLLASVNAKYYIVKKKDIGGIYPFCGITALNQSVYITDLNNTADINGLFKQSGSVNINLSTGFVNMGVGFDLLDFTDENSFYAKFKMGYRHNIGSTNDNKWYVNETRELGGAPVERLNSVYIQFSVGLSLNEKSNKQLRLTN